MNQIFAGGLAFIIALWLWKKGKKPQFPSAFHQGFVNTHAQTDTSIIQTYVSKEKLDTSGSKEIMWSKPKTQRERILLRNKLMQLIKAGPEERMHAVSIARDWGHKTVLPILKRGLKDSDSRIIILAAEGIQKYRCITKNSQCSIRPPLNIFLMR
tara:strand:- start:4551 stop:5015 length:465 start_codon:yes stop_codon:yes gene_type:complete